MYLNEYTGRGVRVAVVDSGVHAGHPHVGGVEQGVAVAATARWIAISWTGWGMAPP